MGSSSTSFLKIESLADVQERREAALMEFASEHQDLCAPIVSFAFELRPELGELQAIADDLEEISDHFGEPVAKYQSGAIALKAERVRMAHDSIAHLLDDLMCNAASCGRKAGK